MVGGSWESWGALEGAGDKEMWDGDSEGHEMELLRVMGWSWGCGMELELLRDMGWSWGQGDMGWS